MNPEGLATKETSCQHHWMIEAGIGPTSKGTCQRCGIEKEFENSIDTYSNWRSGVRMGKPASDTED